MTRWMCQASITVGTHTAIWPLVVAHPVTLLTPIPSLCPSLDPPTAREPRKAALILLTVVVAMLILRDLQELIWIRNSHCESRGLEIRDGLICSVILRF